MLFIEKVYYGKSGPKTHARPKVITIKNKRAIVALNRSPVLVHQSYSVDPTPSPHPTQTFSTYQILRLLHTNIKALCFVVSEKIFSCHPYIILYKACDPGAGPFLTI